jgi:hypothetical protein
MIPVNMGPMYFGVGVLPSGEAAKKGLPGHGGKNHSAVFHLAQNARDPLAPPSARRQATRLLRVLGCSGFPAKLVGLGVAVSGIAACSLNYQTVYEADVRFEHCYRLDEERAVELNEKLQCWRDWSQKHTLGQSRDRIEYAFARQQALGQAQAAGLPTAPPGAPITRQTAPQPTNAFAPPPPTLARDAGVAASPPSVSAFVESNSASFAASPGTRCSDVCSKGWISCGGHCRVNGCQSSCDDLYRTCMRACL